ncbi:TRAP transporter small permease [Marinomonas foliarum]|uniref:TRAP transporter small permease protein n=1 Tax=Marinomonas foliarum TaxID=491950 RepID=A0A368ZU28_9GAMM|nr:TRAP transporter small permease [Marinomonas foliarum]RCW99645.1 TRAP-type C4-dicarboxylate transport system permease small subunit [Marinomonas foliarum]
MHRFQHFLKSVMSCLTVLSGICLIFILGITVLDVVSRNVFGKSILGTVDLSSLLLVTVAFLGLALAEIEGRHVSVDLVERGLKDKSKFIFSIIRLTLFLIISLIVSWGLFNDVLTSIDRSETTNGVLRISTWPTKIVLFFSFILYFFVLVVKSTIEMLNLKNKVYKKNINTEVSINNKSLDRSNVKKEGGEYGA